MLVFTFSKKYSDNMEEIQKQPFVDWKIEFHPERWL